MVDTFWLHRTGTQLIDSLVRCAPNDYESNVSANYSQTCVPLERQTRRNIVCLCRSWIFLRLMPTTHRLRSGKLKTTSRADRWTHVRSKLLVTKKYSICGTWKCASTRTDPWMQQNGGESTPLKSWRLEDSPEAWHLHAIFPQRLGNLHSGARRCFFTIVGRQEGREHAPRLLRRAYELSKVVTLGPLVVAVTDSEFLGQDTDVATVGNRI